MDRKVQEWKGGETEWLKKMSVRALRPSIHPTSYIFFSYPLLPPSILRSLPSSPRAFLSRHASVPANQHRPGQGEGARRGGWGGKQRSTVAASLGFWGGSTRCVVGGGVQTERECDWGGLSLRIEIKMNGRGAGVSAVFTVIKKTSSAIFFFKNTHTHSLQLVWVSVRDRGGMGSVHCFSAIVQCLLYPRVLSVQLYATNEMGKECVCVYDGSCHSC